MKHSEETTARSSASNLLQQTRPTDRKCPPPMVLLPPTPMAAGVDCRVDYTGTQWCFRSLEVCSQGTTRISKSQRSFCRQSTGREGGVSLGPGLPPPNSQPGPTMRGCPWLRGQVKGQRQIPGPPSQRAHLLLRKPQSPLPTGPPQPGLSHAEAGRGSVWPARLVQAGQPEGLGLLGGYLLLGSCGQGAGGEVHVVSCHRTLPAGRAPHLHGQVVLNASHQLGRRAEAGQMCWGGTPDPGPSRSSSLPSPLPVPWAHPAHWPWASDTGQAYPTRGPWEGGPSPGQAGG